MSTERTTGTVRRETGRPTHATVLVIGSGPVGTAFAQQVAERHPRADVLVVEVGPWVTADAGVNAKNLQDLEVRAQVQVDPQGPTRHPYPVSTLSDRTRSNDAATGDERLDRPGTFLLDSMSPGATQDGMPAAALSSAVGGMGVHWTCACPWPYGSERSDAISAADWEEALTTARTLLRVTSTAYPPGRIADAVLTGLKAEYPDTPAHREPQPMPLAVQTSEDGRREWTGPAQIWEHLPSDAQVSIRPDTLARRIVVEGDRAVAVELEDLTDGARWTTTADLVYVAAGSFRTPQLLWASHVRPDALGRYLNDHTQVLGLVQLDVADADRSADQDPVAGMYWIPFSDEVHPFHGQVMQFDLSPIPLVPGAEGTPTGAVGLGYFVPKEIRAQDRLEFLDEETDYLGMPAIRVHYTLTDADQAAVETARRYIERSARAIGRLHGPTRLLEPGSSLHYQGSTRLGASDDGTSVLDPDGRVWGYTNLFVGGNSVIPSPTAGNPTLTSVAIATLSARAAAQLLAYPASPSIAGSPA